MKKFLLLTTLFFIVACAEGKVDTSSRKLAKDSYEIKVVGEKGVAIETLRKQTKPKGREACGGPYIVRGAKEKTLNPKAAKAKSSEGESYIITTEIECVR